MSTNFATAADGTRIAYDVTGSGPALMLLHGSNQTRRHWHEAGYVDRLAPRWQVITVDLRGTGESDFTPNDEDHIIDKIRGDLLAVADAAGVDRFILWGFSLGGGIGRYLTAASDRVAALVVVGSPVFGATIDESTNDFVKQFLQKYEPVLAAWRTGALPPEQAEQVVARRLPVWVARFHAMRAWPAVGPADLHCPTLLVIGTENEIVYRWSQDNRAALAGAGVQVEVLPGLTHEQEFYEVERVYPLIERFLNRNRPHDSFWLGGCAAQPEAS